MPPALLCSRVNRVLAPSILLGAVADGIVDGGAERLSRSDSLAHFHCLHCLQGHHRPGEQAVETLIPIGVGAKPGGRAVDDDLKDAADGVAGAQDVIDFRFHLLFGFRVDAVQQHFIALAQGGDLFPGGDATAAPTRPTRTTWLLTSMPSDFSSSLAMAPAATRAVDSRAEARSST